MKIKHFHQALSASLSFLFLAGQYPEDKNIRKAARESQILVRKLWLAIPEEDIYRDLREDLDLFLNFANIS